MNTIELKKIITSQKYENDSFVIDGKPLYEYLTEWYEELHLGEIQQPLAPVDDLA
jgi:dihydrofolate reductase